jgi:hypothetical protein
MLLSKRKKWHKIRSCACFNLPIYIYDYDEDNKLCLIVEDISMLLDLKISNKHSGFAGRRRRATLLTN